jgi:hypothetical protein
MATKQKDSSRKMRRRRSNEVIPAAQPDHSSSSDPDEQMEAPEALAVLSPLLATTYASRPMALATARSEVAASSAQAAEPSLADQLAAVTANINSQTAALIASSSRQFVELLVSLDAKTEKRFSLLEKSVSSVSDSHDALAHQFASLSANVERLQQQMVVAAETPTESSVPISSGRPFDGPVDHTIIRLETMANALVAKVALMQVLTEQFAHANISAADFELRGDPTSSKFTIKFSGPPAFAARRAAAARGSLRSDTGQWTELCAPLPAGGSVRLFLNPDRNAKQIKVERESKRLGAILSELYPAIKWRVNRSDGEVSQDWVGFAKLEVHADNLTTLRWNLPALAASSVDKAEVTKRFHASTRQRAEVQWSV